MNQETFEENIAEMQKIIHYGNTHEWNVYEPLEIWYYKFYNEAKQ